ncbi:hypothetical protein NGRA_0653 [Nosema granulosis]|uniref:Uncharacterized protein n=1 Tax=Nosema granulosis TaxID=83296 RepID=A0A9P6H1L4_9MICR|nr:hypothetical protein NGRA_0653 [Nosema granulosis]
MIILSIFCIRILCTVDYGYFFDNEVARIGLTSFIKCCTDLIKPTECFVLDNKKYTRKKMYIIILDKKNYNIFSTTQKDVSNLRNVKEYINNVELCDENFKKNIKNITTTLLSQRNPKEFDLYFTFNTNFQINNGDIDKYKAEFKICIGSACNVQYFPAKLRTYNEQGGGYCKIQAKGRVVLVFIDDDFEIEIEDAIKRHEDNKIQMILNAYMGRMRLCDVSIENIPDLFAISLFNNILELNPNAVDKNHFSAHSKTLRLLLKFLLNKTILLKILKLIIEMEKITPLLDSCLEENRLFFKNINFDVKMKKDSKDDLCDFLISFLRAFSLDGVEIFNISVFKFILQLLRIIIEKNKDKFVTLAMSNDKKSHQFDSLREDLMNKTKIYWKEKASELFKDPNLSRKRFDPVEITRNDCLRLVESGLSTYNILSLQLLEFFKLNDSILDFNNKIGSLTKKKSNKK